MPSVRAQKNEKSKVDAFFTVLAVLLAAAMIAFSLVVRTKIAQQNDKNVELSAQLSELKDENIRLEIQIYSAVALDELEDAARNEFGMLPPGNQQQTEINVKTEDKAVILGNGEEKSDAFGDWISSLRNIINSVK